MFPPRPRSGEWEAALPACPASEPRRRRGAAQHRSLESPTLPPSWTRFFANHDCRSTLFLFLSASTVAAGLTAQLLPPAAGRKQRTPPRNPRSPIRPGGDCPEPPRRAGRRRAGPQCDQPPESGRCETGPFLPTHAARRRSQARARHSRHNPETRAARIRVNGPGLESIKSRNRTLRLPELKSAVGRPAAQACPVRSRRTLRPACRASQKAHIQDAPAPHLAPE